MSRFQHIKPTSRKGGLLSGYTGDPSGIWSLRQRYELLTFPLLDYHPGATAAYSLRSLSSSYTGPVVTVRRSSDDAEADFTASEVAGGALETWVGAGNDGFVTTWYDQSGNNGRNASQSTDAEQPQICSNGSLILSSGKPAIQFATSNAILTPIRLQTAAFTVSQPVTYFSAYDHTATDDRQMLFDGRSGGNILFFGDTTTGYYMVNAGSQLISSTALTTGPALVSVLFNGSSSVVRRNSLQVASGNAGGNAVDGLTIGNIRGFPSAVANNYSWVGRIQELIVYPADMSSQQEDIETEISQAYGI